MLHLDLYTLTAVASANFLLAGIGLLSVRQMNQGCSGLRRCSIACLSLALAFAVISLSLANPTKPRILLINVFFLNGAILLLDGIRAFRGFARPVRLYILVTGIFAAAFCWFLYVDDSPAVRSAMRAFFLGTIALSATASLALKVPRRDRAVYIPTAAAFGGYALSAYVRGFAGIFGPHWNNSQPGIWDYVSVVTLNLFAPSFAFGLSMAANLRLQRNVERMAYYDVLTDLPNRRHFEEHLEAAERKAFANNERLALIYCDLDDFKHINDTYGHERGDAALRTVASKLRSVVGNDTCLSRVGGDEFVLLIENAPEREEIIELIDRLRAAVEIEPLLRISCGVAVLPEDVGSASDLIRLADAGMYMLKQNGRSAETAA